MKLPFKASIIIILKIGYFTAAAFIGFIAGYALFSIKPLPVENTLFTITNYLTAILTIILSLVFSAGVMYLAYKPLRHFNEKYRSKSVTTKSKSSLQLTWQNFGKRPLNLLLITIIILLTLIKLQLIGTGFLAFPDEIRYCQSGKAFQDLLELKIRAAIRVIYFTQGRPADGVLKIIPITLQYITAHIYKLTYFESNNSFPLFIYNYFIYCAILLVHFRFSKLLLRDGFLALISVLFFSTLTNSYLYLRHALPYDMSLLILYLVIYKIVIATEENRLSFQKSLMFGFCSFLGFLVYPGYFPLLIIGLLILLFNNISQKDIFIKVYYSGCYLLGGILCLFICEKIARRVGTSYILDAIGLSITITQGSFEESFAYIFKYLFEVEGLTGIILLICLPTLCLMILYQIKTKTFKEYSLIMLLGIALIGNYLVYASAGYFLQVAVFYGRLLHQYLPFMVILAIYSLNELLIKVTIKKQLILLLISFIFIINFLFNFKDYNSYAYPRDIFWQLVKAQNLNYVEYTFEYDDHWPVMPKGIELKYSDIDGKLISSYYNIIFGGNNFNAKIYLINNLTKCSIFNPNDNYHLLESKSSFMNFKAYQYDSGINMIDRHNMDKTNLQIETFSQ